MRQCAVVEIRTPKGVVLNGLWFGPKRPKRAIVWVHGLGGSAFGMARVTNRLVDKKTAVLMLNNRGHDLMARLSRAGAKRPRAASAAGKAHEVFTDCADDIQGAINFTRRQGTKNIFLAGHSTGCQKSAYWANRKKGRGVKGIILLAPVSDYAAACALQGKRRIARAAEAARALIRHGKKHALLPGDLWHETLDAQRFLSLYSPDSVEEIFSYSQPGKVPRILKSIRKPLLVLLAGADEYWDRPVAEVADWFKKHIRAKDSEVRVIPRVKHHFKEGDAKTAGAIRAFMKESA